MTQRNESWYSLGASFGNGTQVLLHLNSSSTTRISDVSIVRYVEDEPIFATDNFSDCIWKQKQGQGEQKIIPGHRNRDNFSPKRRIVF